MKFENMLKNTDNDYSHPTPPNSYSRELDSRVQASEMPYGYLTDAPPADSGDFNQAAIETRMQKRPRK